MPPKQVQPLPSWAASSASASWTSPGSTRKRIAWCTTAAFCGRKWLPVMNAGAVSAGSMRKHR
jgi:hypothetical protein